MSSFGLNILSGSVSPLIVEGRLLEIERFCYLHTLLVLKMVYLTSAFAVLFSVAVFSCYSFILYAWKTHLRIWLYLVCLIISFLPLFILYQRKYLSMLWLGSNDVVSEGVASLPRVSGSVKAQSIDFSPCWHSLVFVWAFITALFKQTPATEKTVSG